MNRLFDLFRGGLVFEVRNVKEARIAEKSGAVALLLDMDSSPVHPDGNTLILDEILEKIRLPLIASFRPGHFVEAEMLAKMNVWGIYADSRFHPVAPLEGADYSEMTRIAMPMIADVGTLEEAREASSFIPVIRARDSLDEIFEHMKEKTEDDFLFITGPIETVSDIALLKRMGADTILVPNSVFEFPDSDRYLKKLVQASFYYDDTEKLAKLLEVEKEEEGKKKKK